MGYLDYPGLGRFLDKLKTIFPLASTKGQANGFAELDASGKVPTSQLPSYVDDVIEVSTYSALPIEGETGKIYVTTDDNKTYRWSGSSYVEISASLALGETDATAYRGDRGKIAYDHAFVKGSAFGSGLYKITTNAEGHVTAAIPVKKSDITDLGIPGQDTNTTYSAGSNITLSGTTFSLTKANVTGALGYTPPTTDTNTTYSAGANITLNGTTFSLTKSNVTGALGYTPLQNHQSITKSMVTAALGYTPPSTNTTYSAGSNITLNGTTFSLTKANVTGALGYTPGTSSLTLGTTASTAAAGSHTHDLSMSSSYSGSIAIELEANKGYLLTAGGKNYIFKTPPHQSITKAKVTAALGYTPPTTNTTYSAGSNITLSGTTFSLTKANVTGALGYTPPTTDTNTWRGIKNDLTSTDTDKSLSAAQGKILNDKFANYVNGAWLEVGTQVTQIAGQTNPPAGTNFIRVHLKLSTGSVCYCDFTKYG